jgi:hypothetical protein
MVPTWPGIGPEDHRRSLTLILTPAQATSLLNATGAATDRATTPNQAPRRLSPFICGPQDMRAAWQVFMVVNRLRWRAETITNHNIRAAATCTNRLRKCLQYRRLRRFVGQACVSAAVESGQPVLGATPALRFRHGPFACVSGESSKSMTSSTGPSNAHSGHGSAGYVASCCSLFVSTLTVCSGQSSCAVAFSRLLEAAHISRITPAAPRRQSCRSRDAAAGAERALLADGIQIAPAWPRRRPFRWAEVCRC